jgi:thiol-disulfide isomerase/thioredoxin
MKLKLVKVGAAWCGPCHTLAKRGTLEKFEAKHPDVKVEVHDDPSEDGEPTAGTKRWESYADSLNVKSLPTLVWFHGTEELLRSSDVSAAGIEAQYARALKKAGLE